jgi:ribonuclease-3
MRPRLRSTSGPRDTSAGRPLELVRVRGAQRDPRHEGRELASRSRRRGGRGRGRSRSRGGSGSPPPPPAPRSLWAWLLGLFAPAPRRERGRERVRPLSEQEERALAEFSRHFGITFNDPSLLKLALTHRSYLSVTGQGPRESNERLEFLGDSVLGLVTSEYLYRQYPNEHEGHLTKIKSLLVSKAILSRRALAMGLGRFVLMSHSEVESGGRQRLSILADAFEAVLGAVYLDQGFEEARAFIDRWLLRDARAITSDERHVNYKSHLQEYVQSTYHTHPVYRIRSEYGPDHSKHFNVDVMVGRRVLGSGKGRNKKEAEQAAARGALDQAGALPRPTERRERDDYAELGDEGTFASPDVSEEREEQEIPDVAPERGVAEEPGERRTRRRGRRGGRARRERESGRELGASGSEGAARAEQPRVIEPRAGGEGRRGFATENATPAPPRPRAWSRPDEEFEEIGRPEGPLEERHVDPFDWEKERQDAAAAEPTPSEPLAEAAAEPVRERRPAGDRVLFPGFEREPEEHHEPVSRPAWLEREAQRAARPNREAQESAREPEERDEAQPFEPAAAADDAEDSGRAAEPARESAGGPGAGAAPRPQPQFGRRSARTRTRPGGR